MRQPKGWGIKLGSGGVCIPFCERHQVIGLGWSDVDTSILASGSWSAVESHVRTKFGGRDLGQLWRFARDCEIGDYVLYYDPPRKQVRITRVISPVLRRDFDLTEGATIDIWQCRRVEYPVEPIPILDFYGGLKGSLLGPRMSFWTLPEPESIVAMAAGRRLGHSAAPDPELEEAYRRLQGLVLKRAAELNEKDWEIAVADYFKEQGAHIEGRVGGNRAVVDIEARFRHGEIGDELWRVQVKRYQDRVVDWPEIEACVGLAGEARFSFFSVFGFTEVARVKAEENDVLLLEAGDLVRFLIGGRASASIQRKLGLPLLKRSA